MSARNTRSTRTVKYHLERNDTTHPSKSVLILMLKCTFDIYLLHPTYIFRDVRYFLVFALKTECGFSLNPSMSRSKSLRWFYSEPTIYILSKNKKQNIFFFFSSKNFDCFVLFVLFLLYVPDNNFFQSLWDGFLGR